MNDRWTWTVEERFAVVGRGVVVLGERAGELPIRGESCVIDTGTARIESWVGGFEMMDRGDGRPPRRDDFRGHEYGLHLIGVDPEDVPIGALVRPKLVFMTQT